MSEPKDILNDDEAMKAIRTLRERGYSPNEVIAAFEYGPSKREQCPKCGLYVADKDDTALLVIEMKPLMKTGDATHERRSIPEGVSIDSDGGWERLSYACKSGRCAEIQIEEINKKWVCHRAVGYKLFVPPA